MAIDISTDLIIQANATILSTPTIDNIYDIGGSPGDYNPGKDYAETDNVSRGNTATYSISISLNSITNQNYPIDTLTIGSADIAGNLSHVNVYTINDDPDALNTVDSGINTLVSNVVAVASPVVLDSGISSNSTLTVNLIFNLPVVTYWKTKIVPNVTIIAEKDGIKKTYTFEISPVKLAPKAYFVSSILTDGNFQNAVTFSPNSFKLPFFINSFVQSMANVTGLANKPDFASVTYQINVTATVNGTVNAVIPPNGFTFTTSAGVPAITSYTYVGTLLTFTVTAPYAALTSQNYSIGITANAEYTPTVGESNANVVLSAFWAATNPVSVVANNNNQILFDIASIGGVSLSAIYVDLTNGGIGALKIRQNIANSGLYTYGILQSETATHDDLLVDPIGSQYIVMLDSQISSLKPNAQGYLSINYTDLSGIPHEDTLDPSFYVQTFAYATMPPPVYDPNPIIQQVLLGTIASGSYASIVAGGNKPNIRIITLLKNPWVGTNYNPMITHTINFTDVMLDAITSTEFQIKYNANPATNFTSNLYSYTSLNTSIATVALANALFGQLLASMDEFQLRNGSVFLNLGSVASNIPENTTQFNDVSVVRNAFPMSVWFSEFENGIVNASGVAVNPISDYSQQYYYVFRRKVQSIQFWNAAPIILAGTPVEFDLPTAFAQYFVIQDTPYILDNNGNKIPILNYQYDGYKIQFHMPVEMVFNWNGPGVYIPIRFIVPSQNIVANFTAPIIPPADIVANLPSNILDRFPSGTPYYGVNYYPFPTQLIGVQIDTTGLSVAPSVYPNGSSVKYTADVYNIDFTTSDYYTINTVPTNQYNEIETSNNTQPAYINKIITFNPITQVYYQTADKVTPADIQMSKILQGTPNLMNYYNNTIKITWTLWDSTVALPNNVVMISSFTPNILNGQFVRIDYDVKVEMDINTSTLYINNASFKYFSTGSSLEAHSNVVRIQNMPLAVPTTPVKTVSPTSIDGLLTTAAQFTVDFPLNATVNTDATTTINLKDVIDPRLTIVNVTTNLAPSTFYTITDLSVGNIVEYAVVTNIPVGETGDLPTTITLKIDVSYKGNGICPLTLPNTATMQIDSGAVAFSNTVNLQITTTQSRIDLIESTALMQTAVAHILNAEGEKLQKIIATPGVTSDLLIKTNKSAQNLIKSITRLEQVMMGRCGATSGCCTKNRKI